MRRPSFTLFTVLIGLVVLLLPIVASADDWNRATTAIFNQPVQVPGKVLPAGIYIFKLAEISGERNVVQIWNVDETVLVATLMGWPEYLPNAPSENGFVLEEQGKGKPVALKAWMYRGNSHVETFVYPKESTK
jgi:hypothetical protein